MLGECRDDGGSAEPILDRGPQHILTRPVLTAAITETGACSVPHPCALIQRATAEALRRHAATTGIPLTAAEMAEPFGDGRTKRSGAGARRNAAGDSDHGCRAETARRPTASSAWLAAAYSSAVRSRHR